MSLMERTYALDTQVGTSCVSADTLSTLREKVNERISVVDAAKLISDNPRQARSELRAACEAVLKAEPWLAGDAGNVDVAVERYLDSVFGLGPLEDLLADDSVTEIMVNGDSGLFFEREGIIYEVPQAHLSNDEVYALIDRIIGPLGRRIDESCPMVNARLPQGHRVNAIIPPPALDGPAITIRKFRSHAYTLDEMRMMGSFDTAVQTLLEWAVLRRCNIAVSGGTGSGKTTLLNSLSYCIPEDERIVTIEDSAELRFTDHKNLVRLEARSRNTEGRGEITIRDLVINSLRMRPDRIIVGECRSSEALEMLQAMNTGHDGSLTTLHSNSPIEAIDRLVTMVRYGAELPVDVIKSQIAHAIDLVIQTTRRPDGSRGICEIVGYCAPNAEQASLIEPYYQHDLITGEKRWVGTPSWIDDLPYLGIASKEEVESWKQSIALSDLPA